MSESEQNTSASDSSHESSDTEDIGEILPIVDPYDGEPLASSSDEEGGAGHENHEADEDGILYATLEARFRGIEAVDFWCSCNECKVELLVGAREFRCCWDIAEAIGKLTYDGTIDQIQCVTSHPDYIAVTNQAILKMVAPLLKDKTGRSYRKRGNQTENEFMRAVSYRWLIRWIFGYLGWNKTRPLPACIYYNIRSRFPSPASKGYATTEERE